MPTHASWRLVRSAAASIALASSLSAAHAQFDYQTQQRSVSVSARALVTTVTPPANYYDPPTYSTTGDRRSDSASTAAADFGVFDRTVSVTASYAGATVTSTSFMHSELLPNEIRMTSTAELFAANRMGNMEYYRDSASADMTITFRLASATDVALDRTQSLSYTDGNTSGLMNISPIQLTGPDGITQTYFTGSQTLSLAAGDYTLVAAALLGRANPGGSGSGILTSSLVIRAVPEASTWWMMGLGLPALLAVSRRRHGQAMTA